VPRVVVVSTSEVDRSSLEGLVEAGDELVVVVPAVEQSKLQWLANDEDDARKRAREVGESVADEAPATASAIEVTPDGPRQAVLDAIAEHDPDRVVVALRDGEDATWLEEGELAKVPGRIAGVPVARLRL
jgi:siroheme synthase (precorrin-2 oxidase/ferrochelatase)